MSMPIHERIAAFLEECGHIANIEPVPGADRRYYVRFKTQGEPLQVNVDLDDSYFLYISAAYELVHPRPSDDELRRIMVELQTVMKAVKFSFDDGNPVAQVEQFWVEPDGFKPFFWRCVSIIEHAASDLMRRIATDPESAPPALDAKHAAERFIAELPLLRGPGERGEAEPPARYANDKPPGAGRKRRRKVKPSEAESEQRNAPP